MTIFNKKLSLQGLSATLFKRKKTTRYFVEVEIVEAGEKQTFVELAGIGAIVPNEKILVVEE